MPKGSPELTKARRDEIISACEKLYQTKSFKEITIKEIAENTSFSRASVYNYFETKEEVFTALMAREYEGWALELKEKAEASRKDGISRAEAADIIAESLARREQLLKLLSMNHFDMEEGTRMEMLVEFKLSFYGSIQAVRELLGCIKPSLSKEETDNFSYLFFPALFGVYPYCHATEKQAMAMTKAGFPPSGRTIRDMVYRYAATLLGC